MNDHALREHVLFLLNGGGAHASFDDVIRDFPADLRGKKHRATPYSAWQLLEHVRLAQADILDFCVNPGYREPSWPAGYWPKAAIPESDLAWEHSIRHYRRDLAKIEEVVRSRDLFEKIPWGSGQTYLREALLVADHTAYHLGEMVVLRRLLGAWK
jgi:hypothetical protein